MDDASCGGLEADDDDDDDDSLNRKTGTVDVDGAAVVLGVLMEGSGNTGAPNKTGDMEEDPEPAVDLNRLCVAFTSPKLKLVPPNGFGVVLGGAPNIPMVADVDDGSGVAPNGPVVAGALADRKGFAIDDGAPNGFGEP